MRTTRILAAVTFATVAALVNAWNIVRIEADQSKPKPQQTQSQRAEALQQPPKGDSAGPLLSQQQFNEAGTTMKGANELLGVLANARAQAIGVGDRDTGYITSLRLIRQELVKLQAGKAPTVESREAILTHGLNMITLDYLNQPAERASETVEVVRRVFMVTFVDADSEAPGPK